MATEITMPKLSDTMEEGTILKWNVKEGDRVSQGDIIAEVETDKAAMEMEAYEDGTVSALKVKEGETVAVGTVIAVFDGEGAKAKEAEKKREEPEKTKEEAREKESEKEPEEAEPEEKEPEEAEPEEPSRPARKAEKKEPARAPEREEKREQVAAAGSIDIVASPAARQMARQKGLDLSRVRGTGPGGRIVTADVEKALQEEPPSRKPTGEKGKRKERSVKIRRIVAKKMVESWQSAPHFFVTVAVDMTDAIRLRKEEKVTINDLIIAACARSLQEHPWVNSRWGDGETVEQKQINISLAVATDQGLYNPVIADCGRLSLREISRKARDLGERAHAGRLKAEDMEGGTFTISNMGMLGVEQFSAIITPPQAAVLAVGTIKGEAVVTDQGEPGVAPMVRLTLSADHRILDGADAADFLTTLKSYLEAPVTLTRNDYGRDKE